MGQLAGCLLEEKFGKKRRFFIDHWPVIAFRPAIEKMEATWRDRWEATAACPRAKPGNLNWAAFTTMYLGDVGWAKYSGRAPYSEAKYNVLHTNADICPRQCDGYKKDVTQQKSEELRKWLARATKHFRWVNLQGPGFDDAYRYIWSDWEREYSPVLTFIAQKWFNAVFPDRSEFEV